MALTCYDLLRQGTPVHNAILRHCTPLDYARLLRTNRAFRSAVLEFFQLAYRVDTYYGRFLPQSSIQSFRVMQYQTGCIIGGSFAIQFLDRTAYEGCDVNLYVDHRFLVDVASWFLDQPIRFSLNRLSTMDPAPELPISSQHVHHHQLGEQYKSRLVHSALDIQGPFGKIEILSTQRSPLNVVKASHSTCIMNFLTYDQAYSLYPRATFHNRTFVCRYRSTVDADQQVRKYEDRGWKLVDALNMFLPEEPTYPPEIGPLLRHAADGYSWCTQLYPKFSSVFASAMQECSTNRRSSMPQVHVEVQQCSFATHCAYHWLEEYSLY